MALPGHVFTKQEIFERLWADTAVTDHALTRVVAQLRRVLGDEARQARYLETVPTRGYRWIHPIEEGDAPVAVVEPEPVAVRPVRRTLMPGLNAAAVLGLVVVMTSPGRSVTRRPRPWMPARRRSPPPAWPGPSN